MNLLQQHHQHQLNQQCLLMTLQGQQKITQATYTTQFMWCLHMLLAAVNI
jgi:hypothetical protein